MARLTVNGIPLYLDQDGVGPPLVLVHGLGDESGLWAPVAARLRDRFTLLRFDLRGHGLSGGERPGGPIDLALLDADLVALLDRLGVQRASYIGHDLGGAIVQRLAFGSPGRVHSLVLEGALPALLDEEARSLPVVDECGVAERALAAQGPSSTSPAQADPIRRLAAITCPTLVVVGELDGPAFQHGAEVLHGWIPNSRLVRIPDAGHAPHVEQPARFLEHLRTFLDEFG
jgi:pimeloyl-ACP methyl ester carboxylesterase